MRRDQTSRHWRAMPISAGGDGEGFSLRERMSISAGSYVQEMSGGVSKLWVNSPSRVQGWPVQGPNS